MTQPLPFEFYACVAGAALGGGLLLWLLHRLYRRAPVLARLRRLPATQRATTIVEFPFVLLLVVQIALFTWQLGLMAAAYVVMDYAAYAAVRSAIVIIPEEYKEEDHGVYEQKNELHSSHLSAWDAIMSRFLIDGDRLRSGKGTEIRTAAVFACYPISGVYRAGHFDTEEILDRLAQYGLPPNLGKDEPQGVLTLPMDMGADSASVPGLRTVLGDLIGDPLSKGIGGLEDVEDVLPGWVDYINRFGYAWMNTRVRVQPDADPYTITIEDVITDDWNYDNAKSFLDRFTPESLRSWDQRALYQSSRLPQIKGGSAVTVEVSHDFQLSIPYAGAILAGWPFKSRGEISKPGVGWFTTLTTRATMLNEGYPEAKPKGAPEDKKADDKKGDDKKEDEKKGDEKSGG